MSADDDALTEQIEKRIDEIQNSRDFAAVSISTQARTICLGVLALVWLLLGGTQEALSDKFHCHTNSLLAIAVVCVLALMCDFAQYIVTYIDTDRALDEAIEATTLEQAQFNDGALRKSSQTLFVLKIIATAVASFWLLIVMFGALTQ